MSKVVTGKKTRLSYAHIFEPYSYNNQGEPDYSCCVLIPKQDKKTVDAIKAAIEAAKENGKSSKWGGKIPAKIASPLHDGDEERPDDDAYAGHYFINAKGKGRKPKVFDTDRTEIFDTDEVYSGCYARVVLNFYPYSSSGNNGVSCILGDIMKTADGEPLGTDLGFGNVDFDDDDDEDFLD